MGKVEERTEAGNAGAAADSASSTGDILLERFERSGDAEVRVALRRYKGAQLLDCRTYWRTPDGDLAPSRKGCTFSADQLGRLAAAIMEAQRLTATPSADAGDA